MVGKGVKACLNVICVMKDIVWCKLEMKTRN